MSSDEWEKAKRARDITINTTFEDRREKPYIRLKAFFILWLPVVTYLFYGAIAGFWEEDVLIYIPVMAAIIAVPFYNIAVPIFLMQPCCDNPGSISLVCPGCGHSNDPHGRLIVAAYNRVMPVRCPKCELVFEMENMSQWIYSYDDEPIPGMKYGDPSKIRVKPKVGFRFGNFVLTKNPRSRIHEIPSGFYSDHWPLDRVVPAALILIGAPLYFGLFNWEFVLLATLVTLVVTAITWGHPLGMAFRDALIDILKELGVVRKSYTLRWWEAIIVNLVTVVFLMVLLFLFPWEFV